MFNDMETQSLHKHVVQKQLSNTHSCDIVLTDLVTSTDFGEDFFHKVLSKGILKPNTIQAD